MSSLRTQSKTILGAFAAMLLFTAISAAQIAGLCNTGQTAATSAGCTGALVPPNPTGGGPNRDGNWGLTYRPLSVRRKPCLLQGYVNAWVDTPYFTWLPNSVSTASEWITTYDGEASKAAGWYAYRVAFPVPFVLPGGTVPTGVTINGQLTSDNSTFAIFLESPANSGNCSIVSGQKFPVNPYGGDTFQQWWPFSFTNASQITPGADAYLYFVVQNMACNDGCFNPTGFRAEFFSTSAFN